VSAPRIVNSAKTGKDAGNEVYFCGSTLYDYIKDPVFEKIYHVGWGSKREILTKWRTIKKQIGQVLDELRPDIIHAHDIFAARMAAEFDYPFVFNDHELFSKEFQASVQNKVSTLVADMQFRLIAKRCAEWERLVAERAPIIAVSELIAAAYEEMTSKAFVVPNFPRRGTIKERELSEATPDNLTSVYLGADTEERVTKFRDITGLYECFRKNDIGKLVRIGVDHPNDQSIQSLGFLTLNDGYHVMQERCHTGLIPWRPHWFHRYASPSKAFEYAHCGLALIVTPELREVIDRMQGHIGIFANYEELAEKLQYFKEHPEELNLSRKVSVEHARTNLIWEKHEQKILDAYKLC
jgi:hypothetical protein